MGGLRGVGGRGRGGDSSGERGMAGMVMGYGWYLLDIRMRVPGINAGFG